VLSIFALSAVLSCSSSTAPVTGLPPHDVAIVQGAATMASNAFSPNPFTVKLSSGGKVTWANGDFTGDAYGGTGVTHHIVSDSPLFDSGLLAPFATFQFTFTAAGSYPYHCMIHPSMVGTIVVN